MTENDSKRLQADPDGLATYEYLANHIENCADDLEAIIDNMLRVDSNGQFTASAAKYLHAIDAGGFAPAVARLIAATIERDREHRYLGSLMTAIWGADCTDRADALSRADDNFRRIYKRLYPRPDSL